ncbi:YOW5 protein, partial [Polypterus senegalus]
MKQKQKMADSEMNCVAVVVEELQALNNKIQKLLSRRRYLRDLKARLLEKPSSPSEIDITRRVSVTSTPRCASHLQVQVSFTPVPRRSNVATDEDLSVFQLCRQGFKARTPPSAQVSILTQNRFDPLRAPSLPSAPGDVIVMGDSIVRNLNITCPNWKSFVSCFPGARVRDVLRSATTVYKKHKNRVVGSIVLHAGVNDVRHRQLDLGENAAEVDFHPSETPTVCDKESGDIMATFPRTAKRVEDIVKANGAIPATIGVLNGKIHVGWSEEELEFLASLKTAVKISRWDLPCVLSKGLSGGMTVSATMIAAHKAGIPVFVTGGIGGVHLGGETTMDVSADLTELGRTPIAVVSAGVKSILDIGRTLEYLETQGVSVATFGKSCDFPAFFVSRSGFLSPYNVTNEEEAAAMIEAALTLGLNSGVLLAVPIPEEKAAIGHQIENAIEKAVAEARLRQTDPFIKSPEIVPVLSQSCGPGALPDMALIENNAKVGSKIAVCLSKRMKRNGFPSALHTKKNKTPENHKMPNTSGIARLRENSTATYCAVITNKGEIKLGFGDMDIHQEITKNYVDRLCSIHYSAIPVPSKNIINVSGAGDSLAAAIMAGILQGHTTDICVKMGLLAAHLSLESKHPTSPHMNRANLKEDNSEKVAEKLGEILNSNDHFKNLSLSLESLETDGNEVLFQQAFHLPYLAPGMKAGSSFQVIPRSTSGVLKAWPWEHFCVMLEPQ